MPLSKIFLKHPSTSLQQILQQSRKQSARLYAKDFRLHRLRRFKLLNGTRLFYRIASEFLENNRFVRLGDYRLTFMPRGSAAYRTPLRFYLSPDHWTVADAYYLQNPMARRIELGLSGMPSSLTLDLTTEFEDGGFLETSNANAAAFVDLPRSVLRVFLSPSDPLPKVLLAHRRELALQRKLGRRPVPVSNAEEMLASVTRLHALKAGFREKIGHTRMSEIKAIKKRMAASTSETMEMLAYLLTPRPQSTKGGGRGTSTDG